MCIIHDVLIILFAISSLHSELAAEIEKEFWHQSIVPFQPQRPRSTVFLTFCAFSESFENSSSYDAAVTQFQHISNNVISFSSKAIHDATSDGDLIPSS